MALSADDYLAQAQALLPQGPAWPRDADAPLTQLLSGLSIELARIDAAGWSLIEEADPRTSSALFADWLRVAGLPDECVTALSSDQSTAQLRAQLVGRLAMVGGQSIDYFTQLASTLGYQISISEYHAHSVNDDVEYPLFGLDWHFVWQVNAALNTVNELTVADTADDFLAAWGNTLLECVFRRLKPAHTLVLFSYT